MTTILQFRPRQHVRFAPGPRRSRGDLYRVLFLIGTTTLLWVLIARAALFAAWLVTKWGW